MGDKSFFVVWFSLLAVALIIIGLIVGYNVYARTLRHEEVTQRQTARPVTANERIIDRVLGR